MGYNNRDNNRYQDRNEMTFKYNRGQLCELAYAPGTRVVVLRAGREQYECRILSSLRIDWFYEYELIPINT